SQERMAVALAAEDVDEFIGYAHEENLEATPIATVTEEARVRMEWNGAVIVDVSRDFLNSNGAAKHQDVRVLPGGTYERTWTGDTLAERMNALVTDLNVCSNKGLSERFDSTIGAGTVLMPFGGSRQLTPAMAMVAKLPVFGETTTVSGMACSTPASLSEQFTGSYIAVVESVARPVRRFLPQDMYLTFQSFEKARRARAGVRRRRAGRADGRWTLYRLHGGGSMSAVRAAGRAAHAGVVRHGHRLGGSRDVARVQAGGQPRGAHRARVVRRCHARRRRLGGGVRAGGALDRRRCGAGRVHAGIRRDG
ncbi:MAG: hypothetical protein ACLR67_00370, partial [Eggerthella lenta]